MERSEKALRRMVSRLPSMATADFDAIMETLSDGQRAKVIKLLEELDGDTSVIGAAGDSSLNHPAIIVPNNLSSWLVVRVNGNPATDDGVTEQFSMTAHATAALRLCAAALVPQPETKSVRLSLFGKLWQRLIRDRFAA